MIKYIIILLLLSPFVKAEHPNATEHLNLYRMQLEQLKAQHTYFQQLSSAKQESMAKEISAIEKVLATQQSIYNSRLDSLSTKISSKMDILKVELSSTLTEFNGITDQKLIKAQLLKEYSETLKERVNWWMALIGVIAIFIPAFFTKEQRTQLKHQLKEIKDQKSQIDSHVLEINDTLKHVKSIESNIKLHEKDAVEIVERMHLSESQDKPNSKKNRQMKEKVESNDENQIMSHNLALLAKDKFETKEFKTAKALFKQLTILHPKNDIYWYNLALCYTGINNKDEKNLNKSISILTKSLSLSQNGRALLSLANNYKLLAHISPRAEKTTIFNKAINIYKEVISIDDTDAEAYCDLGDVYLELSTLSTEQAQNRKNELQDLAQSQYEKAICIDTNYGYAYTCLGLLYLHSVTQENNSNEAHKLFDLAEEQFHKAINTDETYAYPYVCLGNVLEDRAEFTPDSGKENLYKKAIKEFQKALVLDPEYVHALAQIGHAYMSLAELDSNQEKSLNYKFAAKQYESAIGLRNSEDFYYSRLAETFTGLASLEKESERDSLYNTAISNVKKAIELDKYDSYYLSQLGGIYLEIANIKSGVEEEELYLRAISEFEKSISADIDYSYGYVKLGQAYLEFASLKEGDLKSEYYQLSIIQFKKALELDESNNTRHFLASVYTAFAETKSGQDKEDMARRALSLCEEIVKIEPTSTATYSFISDIYINIAKDKQGSLRETYINKALDIQQIGLSNNTKCIKYNIELADTYMKISDILSSADKDKYIELAIVQYTKTINNLNLKADDYEGIGVNYINYANKSIDDPLKMTWYLEKAERFLLKSNELDNKVGLYNLGCAYALLDKPDKARAFIEKASELNVLPNKKYLDTDNDIDNIRKEQWFQELI